MTLNILWTDGWDYSVGINKNKKCISDSNYVYNEDFSAHVNLADSHVINIRIV